MKDLPLSLLSRGCGQFVPLEGRPNGRLDVCFTPEDYYIWRSQDTLLPLSVRGCVLTRQESALPKTYSTRRGALLLYSQGLVTSKTSEANDGKQHFVQYTTAQPLQQGQQQQSIFKKLTLSLVHYSSGLERSHRQPTAVLSPLHPLKPPNEKNSELLLSQQPTLGHDRLKQLSLERISEQQESQHEEGSKTLLDVFLQMPLISAPSSPQNTLENYESVTSEAEENVVKTDHPRETENVQHSNLNSNFKNKYWSNGKLCGDEGFSKQQITNRCSGQKDGSELKQELKGGVLPPLKAGQFVSNKMYRVKPDSVKGCALNSNEWPIEQLPPIEETQRRLACLEDKSQDSKRGKITKELQQPLFLPPLTPAKYDRQRKEKRVNQHKCEPHNQKFKESESSCEVLLNPEEEYPAPFGLFCGKRGPGRQSSLAFMQNPLPEESSDQGREVVRGLLPLELRDLNGQSVGCVILGPDGEVIQLSVFDSRIQDSTQGQALEVFSSEGETLPWVITLQSEDLHSEGSQKADAKFVNIQKEELRNMLFDLQRPTQTGSVKINGDSGAANNKELRESPKVSLINQTASITVKTPELDGTKVSQELRQDTRVKDKNDLSSVPLSQSQQHDKPRYKVDVKSRHTSSEAQFQNNIKDKRRISTIKSTEEAPIFKEEKFKGVSPNSNLQSPSMRGKEDEEINDSRPVTGQQPGDPDGNASETKRSKNKKARTKTIDVRTGDKRLNHDGGEEAASGERSKKKKRKKSKHKEVISETAHHPDTEAIDNDEKTDEAVLKKNTNSSSPKQNKVALTQDDTDTDHFSEKELALNSNKHSKSLRSGSSGSTVKPSSSQKSFSSSYEGGTLPGSAAPQSLSRSCLSSCSTVMIPEERLMLNPTKSAVEQFERSQKDKAAALEAQRLESQRQEEERRRRKQEEEERRQQQKEEVEQKMRNELQNERQRRAEELRLKKQAEDEKRRIDEEEEQKRKLRQHEQREREIRRQQEMRRQMELFQKKREEEEQRRKAEMEHFRVMEEKRLQEENIKLQQMDESERIEYLRKKQQEEDARKKEEEERRRVEEEAALLAAEKAKKEDDLLAREMALLHQRLSFKRGLMVEAEGLEQSQGISRPWTYSYFTLLQLLGLSAAGEHHS